MRTEDIRFDAAMEAMRRCDLPSACGQAETLQRQWLRAASEEERARIAGKTEELADLAGRLSATQRNAIILTPGHILDEMNTVRGIVAQLDKDIMSSKLEDGFKAAWRAFFEEYERFYADHLGWLGRFWAGTYEKAVEYRQRALDWRGKFITIGGRATAPIDTLPEPPGAWIATVAKWLAVAGGVYVAARLAQRFAPPMRTGRNRVPRTDAEALNTALERAANRGGAR